jgi:hypothetical protein
MKIKMGPYPNPLTCNIHTRYMHDRYGWMDWPPAQTKFEDSLEKLEEFIQGIYNVTLNKLLRKEQKVSVKIDAYDTWGMDHTIARIILPMLKQLKATKHGSPMVDDEDVPHLAKRDYTKGEGMQRDMFASDEHDELVWNHHVVRWDWIMDEMIWAFQEKCRDNWEGDYYKYEDDPTNTEGLGIGIKLVWEDREGQQAHHERMQNGFKLFGKYLEGLWD